MNLNLDVKQVGNALGRRAPSPTLTIYVYLTNKSGQSFDLIGATFSLTQQSFSNRNSGAPTFVETSESVAVCRPDRIYEGRDFQLTLNIPISYVVLRYIEDGRLGGNPAGSEMTLNISYRPLIVIPVAGKTDYEGKTVEISIPGAPEWVQVRSRWSPSRDEWLAALQGLGYDEFEIVELPVRKLRQHSEHAKAIEILRRAQEQFRHGSWNECVLNSRLAVESLGHVSAPQEVKGDGPNLHLLLDRITPAGEDGEPRRKALDKLFLALRELRNPTAHAHLPGRDMERAEAELALSMALAVFRYVGERWARPEGAA